MNPTVKSPTVNNDTPLILNNSREEAGNASSTIRDSSRFILQAGPATQWQKGFLNKGLLGGVTKQIHHELLSQLGPVPKVRIERIPRHK